MKEAQYEILVPAGGNVAWHTARYLEGQLRAPVHIEPRTVFVDGTNGAYEVVSAKAEDSPHSDSHVKQTAAYVAEVVNRDTILASKSGEGGIQTWPIRRTGPGLSPASTSSP
jgi:hypothetical protein